MTPKLLKELSKLLSKIQGVGEKTALRYVYSLLSFSKQEQITLSEHIQKLTLLNFCDQCGFITEHNLCNICTSSRDTSILCIVEQIPDLIAVEKTGSFKGLYFILGGVINPLKGLGPDSLPLDKLRNLIINKEIQTVLLALGASPEAETTCYYLREIFKDIVAFERIGLGIPVGSNLEYFDSYTISKALDHRQHF